MPLLVLFAAMVNTVLLGFVSRRLLGVPVGWPRTIAVSLVVSTAMGGLIRLGADRLGLVDDPAAVAPGLEQGVVAAVLVLMTAWGVAVGLGTLVILEALVPTGTLPGPVTLLRDLPARWRRSRRYGQIVTIAVRHGLGGFLRGRAGRVGADRARVAVSLREALADGGVTFVKLGQMLSTRPDLIGAQFATELSHLTSQVAPEDWARVRHTLAHELGADLDGVFAEIDPEPLAAASVGQVHRAVLRDGSPVVVKVQRSDARRQVAADVDIVLRLARWLERSTDWGRSLGVRALAEGFAASLDQELDYRVEAAHVQAVAAAMPGQGRDAVRVPRVYGAWSGPRVLVMERLTGEPLSQAGAALSGLPRERRQELASVLVVTVLRQVLDSGVFHADLHAGNVFLTETGLGLIDFGAVGRLDSASRSGLGRLLLAVDRGDSVAATDALLEVLDRPDGLDDRAVERELGAVVALYRHGVGRAGSAGLFGDLFALVVRHRFTVPPQVAAAFRALGALEGTVRLLDPDLDLMEATRRAGDEVFAERMEPGRLRAELEDQVARLLPVLQRLPRRIDALSEAAQRGELSVQVRMLADERDRSFLTGLVQQLTVTLLASAAAVGGVLLITARGGPEAVPGIGVFPLLGATLFLVGFVLAARALAVAFRHDGRQHWRAPD